MRKRCVSRATKEFYGDEVRRDDPFMTSVYKSFTCDKKSMRCTRCTCTHSTEGDNNKTEASREYTYYNILLL